MSFWNWLGDRTGIHSLRPLAAPAAGIAGGFLGGPMGAALGAGLFSAGDDLANGGNLGSSLKHGALAGGLAYGGGKALGALQDAFAPGSGAGAATAGASGAGGAASSPSGGVMESVQQRLGDQLAQHSGSGGGGGVMGAIKGLGSFASQNPNAVGSGLQGLGAIASSGSENALRRAQADQVAAQTRAMDQEQEDRKRRAEAMEPLLRALMGGMQRPIAPNPYAS